MQEELRALIDKFCKNVVVQLDEVAVQIEQLRKGAADVEAPLARALDVTHQITGLSGSMGYPQISDAARDLELRIRRFETAGTEPEPSEMAEICALFQTLNTLGRAATPQASSLYNYDLSRLAADPV